MCDSVESAEILVPPEFIPKNMQIFGLCSAVARSSPSLTPANLAAFARLAHHVSGYFVSKTLSCNWFVAFAIWIHTSFLK